MKYKNCPLDTNGGIMVSPLVLKIRILTPIQRMVLAYIENCHNGCEADSHHMADVFDNSETQIENAIKILIFLNLVKIDDISSVGLTRNIKVNYESEAWDK
jgi:hypothetical protein